MRGEKDFIYRLALRQSRRQLDRAAEAQPGSQGSERGVSGGMRGRRAQLHPALAQRGPRDTLGIARPRADSTSRFPSPESERGAGLTPRGRSLRSHLPAGGGERFPGSHGGFAPAARGAFQPRFCYFRPSGCLKEFANPKASWPEPGAFGTRLCTSPRRCSPSARPRALQPSPRSGGSRIRPCPSRGPVFPPGQPKANRGGVLWPPHQKGRCQLLTYSYQLPRLLFPVRIWSETS